MPVNVSPEVREHRLLVEADMALRQPGVPPMSCVKRDTERVAIGSVGRERRLGKRNKAKAGVHLRGLAWSAAGGSP